jgi:acylphosphatase
MYRKLSVVRRIAKELDIKGTIENSDKKNKRFMITLTNGKVIHFGQWLYNGRGTFIDHKDEKIKSAWQARHSKILIDDEPAYLNIYSPEYYSWNLLW